MKIKKSIFYFLLISTIILSLLISMLDFNNEVDKLIAKWGIAGLLLILSLSISWVNFSYFSLTTRLNVALVHAILIPGLLLVFLGLLFELFGMRNFFIYFALEPPFSPLYILFAVSFFSCVLCVFYRFYKK